MDEEQTITDEHFMRMALKEAQAAFDEGEIPVGAVVANGGRIIARAHNQTEQLHDVTAHAEMLAISAAANFMGGKYLTGCTLYVTVEPCTMCAGAAGWAQLSRIVYGAADEKRGFRLIAPHALHPRATVTKGVLEDECAELMKTPRIRLLNTKSILTKNIPFSDRKLTLCRKYCLLLQVYLLNLKNNENNSYFNAAHGWQHKCARTSEVTAAVYQQYGAATTGQCTHLGRRQGR